VLAIAVDLHCNPKAVIARVLVPRLHRPSDAEVEGEADDADVCARRDPRGSIGGAVIDDHDVEVGVRPSHFLDDGRNRVGLVVGRNDCDPL
jgi:hypothetical protein